MYNNMEIVGSRERDQRKVIQEQLSQFTPRRSTFEEANAFLETLNKNIGTLTDVIRPDDSLLLVGSNIKGDPNSNKKKELLRDIQPAIKLMQDKSFDAALQAVEKLSSAPTPVATSTQAPAASSTPAAAPTQATALDTDTHQERKVGSRFSQQQEGSPQVYGPLPPKEATSTAAPTAERALQRKRGGVLVAPVNPQHAAAFQGAAEKTVTKWEKVNKDQTSAQPVKEGKEGKEPPTIEDHRRPK